MTEVIIRADKKSNLWEPIFSRLAYPIASGLVRGIKAFITIILATLVAALADGSLFNGISIIPPGQIPLVTAILTPLFLSIEKWFRETGLTNDIVEEEPTSVAVLGPAEVLVVPIEETDIPPPSRAM